MAIKELFDRAYGEASQHIESEQHVTVRASMRGARCIWRLRCPGVPEANRLPIPSGLSTARPKPDNVTNPCAGLISVGHQTAFLNARAF
jgi:hypothetical protein